jgi:magnesium-transporting ATPase (P-type)
MNSISGMLPSSVQVIRDSVEQEILAQDLVLGDIVSWPSDRYVLYT